ncbi:Protein EMP47 [Cladobotryum mycophilum]|uniref:Protein EMP47 n=1 Tax=Cladobotryum mycophilum TaxID=491253 RepID=A0ABR0T0C2_9HYPO
MRSSLLPATLATLLAASLGQAQYLINELSFGYSGRLSSQENPGHIPNFAISGQPTLPELLSNKIVLTPVSPGNYRGAVWSEKTLLHQAWVADVDFRANGPERAGGILTIWLAHNGNKQVGASSVYKVGKFEGLALVVDTHGNTGGMLRGFLNDGTADYSQHHNVDQLAFGHCNFPYRNLGRPSQVKMRQTSDMFRVEIDGKLCFETNKINIPTGYNLGVTAATPDNPDSFEIFKVVVMSEGPKTNNDAPNNNNNYDNSKNDYHYRQQQSQKDNQGSGSGSNSGSGSSPGSNNDWENIDDEKADVFQTSKAQFQDLHNRLQVTNHQLSAVFRTANKHHQMDETRHTEIKNILKDFQSQLNKLNEVYELQRRIDKLENEIRGLRGELGQKIVDNERAFRGVLSNHHDSLSRKMVDTVPGHGKLISVIVGLNVLSVVGYIVYKRRKATPKKYL